MLALAAELECDYEKAEQLARYRQGFNRESQGILQKYQRKKFLKRKFRGAGKAVLFTLAAQKIADEKADEEHVVEKLTSKQRAEM